MNFLCSPEVQYRLTPGILPLLRPLFFIADDNPGKTIRPPIVILVVLKPDDFVAVAAAAALALGVVGPHSRPVDGGDANDLARTMGISVVLGFDW